MRMVRVMNSRAGRELGARICMADGWLTRLRGMWGRPEPGPGEGLFLTPCSSVHMYWMRFPLDVAFLDRSGTVVAIYPSLAPGSRTRWHRNAAHALELRGGALSESSTVVGDQLMWSPMAAGAVRSARAEAAS